MAEATVNYCTLRDAIDSNDLEEIHIECRMSDGCKGAIVIVDADYPELAKKIADFLNNT